ncbi:MAG: P-type conjugative transfer protein TrbJ [Magnetospirillum sp.]|nr:P-type conjugative transfer protein TrbJ [Magnetospirillum sp.]
MLLAVLAQPVRAQMIVFDINAFSQSVIEASRQLEMISNQILSLQNEALMLENQARNLARLDFSALAGMVSALDRIEALINQGQGIALEVAATNAAFAESYPQQYGASVTADQRAGDAHRRWQDAMGAFQRTLVVQAQVARNVQADTATLSDLVNASQGAGGELQAAQAGNQLAALSVKQQLQMQSLMAAQYRAQALDQARAAEGAEQARAAFAQFMGSGSAYGN